MTNHRVVGLSIVVESDLVKGSAARLPSNVLLHHLHISWVKTKKIETQQKTMTKYIVFYIKRDAGICFVFNQSDNSNLSLIQSLCFC